MDQEIDRFYIEDWKESILRDSNDEGIILGKGLNLLNVTGRQYVWHFSRTIGKAKHGIPGSACRILERYLMHINLKIKNMTDDVAKEQLVGNLRKEIRSLAICSVSLASKMYGNRTSCTVLKGHSISAEEIMRIEIEIMKCIDFKLPMWTGVDTVLLLATEVAYEEKNSVNLLMDYAENKLNLINAMYKNVSHNNNTCSIRTVHLAAATVSVIAHYMFPERLEEITNTVANLTAATPTYILALKDVILCVITQPDSTEDTSANPDSHESEFF